MTAARGDKEPTLQDIRTALLDQDSIKMGRAAKACAQDEWWTWPETLTWIAGRDFHDLATLKCWAEFFSEENDADFIVRGQYHIALMACDAKAKGLERSLFVAIEQGRVATVGRRTPAGSLVALEALEWRGGKASPIRGTIQLITAGEPSETCAYDIGVHREGLLIEFPPRRPSMPTHGDVVEWCLVWIRSGNGNGEGNAWPAFTADPKHKGLTRDNVFRPAWKEAKAVITKT